MKTLAELERLEVLAHETGLRNEALQAKFDETRPKATMPLYVHKPGKMRKYFHDIYLEIQGSRTLTGRAPLPSFEVWMGDDGMALLKADDDYGK